MGLVIQSVRPSHFSKELRNPYKAGDEELP